MEGVDRAPRGAGRCINPNLWVADPRQVTFLCSCKEKSPKESTPPDGGDCPRAASHRAVKFSQSTSLCSVRTGAIPRAALRVHSAPAKRLGRAIGWIQQQPTPQRLRFGSQPTNPRHCERSEAISLRDTPKPRIEMWAVVGCCCTRLWRARDASQERYEPEGRRPRRGVGRQPAQDALSGDFTARCEADRGPSRHRRDVFLSSLSLHEQRKGPGAQGRSARNYIYYNSTAPKALDPVARLLRRKKKKRSSQ